MSQVLGKVRGRPIFLSPEVLTCSRQDSHILGHGILWMLALTLDRLDGSPHLLRYFLWANTNLYGILLLIVVTTLSQLDAMIFTLPGRKGFRNSITHIPLDLGA